jgi:predicted ATPase with chaperone activity
MVCHLSVHAVAWSISDLAGRTSPDEDDIAEAVGLRSRLVAA